MLSGATRKSGSKSPISLDCSAGSNSGLSMTTAWPAWRHPRYATRLAVSLNANRKPSAFFRKFSRAANASTRDASSARVSQTDAAESNTARESGSCGVARRNPWSSIPQGSVAPEDLLGSREIVEIHDFSGAELYAESVFHRDD